MTELAGQASALAGIGRTVAGAVVGGPLGRAAAVAYGVRHAVGLRRGTAARPGALPGQVVNGAGLPQGRASSRCDAEHRAQGGSAAVIRRGFWLVAGAAGGIMGYRRVSSLSRQVSETLGARARRQPDAVKRHWARETIRFTRDVREGMDLYSFGRQRATLGPRTRHWCRSELDRIGRASHPAFAPRPSTERRPLMQSAEIARRFLAYFEARGHAIVPSASLVADDPTLLFVVAGHAAVQALPARPADPAVEAGRGRAEVRPHAGHRRGRQDHPARDVLPDARQLVVRRLLQGRRDPLRLGAADQVRRRTAASASPRRSCGPPCCTATTSRTRSGGTRSACRSRGSSAAASRTTTGTWACPAPAAPARRSTTTGPRARQRGRPRGGRGPVPGGLEPGLHAGHAVGGARQGRLRRRGLAAVQERRHRHGPGADGVDPAGRRQPLRDRHHLQDPRQGGRAHRAGLRHATRAATWRCGSSPTTCAARSC